MSKKVLQAQVRNDGLRTGKAVCTEKKNTEKRSEKWK